MRGDLMTDLYKTDNINDNAHSFNAHSASNLNSSTTPYYYSAPNATTKPTTTHYDAYNDSRWYSLEGRVGRIKYLAFNTMWGLVGFVFIFGLLVATSSNGLSGFSMVLFFIVLAPIYICSSILLPRRRLHDLDRSGWWVLLTFVPIANLLFFLYLIFMPGDEGANRFGLPARPNSITDFVLALVLPAFAAIAFLSAPDYVLNGELGDGENSEMSFESMLDTEVADAIDATDTSAASETLPSSDILSYEEFIEVSEAEVFSDSTISE